MRRYVASDANSANVSTLLRAPVVEVVVNSPGKQAVIISCNYANSIIPLSSVLIT